MGVVLLAQDTALDIPVAVKLLPRPLINDTEGVVSLRKEVLRGMALMHRGIVRTNNFEMDESGAGIVMEYVDGENLGEIKAQQEGECFNPDQILPWIEELCMVLDYAHSDARIVHRDLKPRNIMLTRAGRIKVADFGIAAVVNESKSRHSMEGQVSGTLSYMSPQQAQGLRPNHLDDVHALGATIYELLTSKPPFFRGNPAAIMHQIVAVVPPSMAERREDLEIDGKVPLSAVWEETIASCLAKEAGDRPQSAGEVLAKLKSAPIRIGAMENARPAALLPIVPAAIRKDATSKAAARPAAEQPTVCAPTSRRHTLLVRIILIGTIVALGVIYSWDHNWRGLLSVIPGLNPKPISAATPQPASVNAPEESSEANPAKPAKIALQARTIEEEEPAPQPTQAVADAPKVSATQAPPNTVSTPTAPEPSEASKPVTQPPNSTSLEKAASNAPFVNGLGMEFVPVPGTSVLFCRRETRFKDYSDFAEATGRAFPASRGSKSDEPVGRVSWNDAKAFCAWLSEKEGLEYRLPTDQEWSLAVGLGGEVEASPYEKDRKIKDVYPWGGEWPPPKNSGNYLGEEVKSMDSIKGYDDGCIGLAPVGSFNANQFGIYDLGGNVGEWCEDKWSNDSNYRTVRGGHYLSYLPEHCLSCARAGNSPEALCEWLGFRVVLVRSAGSESTLQPFPPVPTLPSQPISKPDNGAPAHASPTKPAPDASKEKPFVNSLGMEFVPVPGTAVLFCRWETREMDYLEFAKATERFAYANDSEYLLPKWQVSWNDAKAFCNWLSEKEGREYRLPTDDEWSVAVGLNHEDGATPVEKAGKIKNVYPWGSTWPPPKDTANFACAEYQDENSIKGYNDGFILRAPVGCYKANKFGIYDLDGNLEEWCEDKRSNGSSFHTIRGGDFLSRRPEECLSCRRSFGNSNGTYTLIGFRVVLVRPTWPKIPTTAP